MYLYVDLWVKNQFVNTLLVVELHITGQIYGTQQISADVLKVTMWHRHVVPQSVTT